MIRLFANANYDFIKWRRWAYVLTAAIIVPGFLLFLVHGLNYSIEFTGGTLIQVQTPHPVGTGRLREALDAAGIRDAEIQQFGAPNEYVVRARLGTSGVTAEGTTQATAAAVDSALSHGLGPAQYKIVRTEAVGPEGGRVLHGDVLVALHRGPGPDVHRGAVAWRGRARRRGLPRLRPCGCRCAGNAAPPT